MSEETLVRIIAFFAGAGGGDEQRIFMQHRRGSLAPAGLDADGNDQFTVDLHFVIVVKHTVAIEIKNGLGCRQAGLIIQFNGKLLQDFFGLAGTRKLIVGDAA